MLKGGGNFYFPSISAQGKIGTEIQSKLGISRRMWYTQLKGGDLMKRNRRPARQVGPLSWYIGTGLVALSVLLALAYIFGNH